MEPLIDKSSQVSLEVAVALSVMPPHNSEPLVNVFGEERYVALALQNAHSAVTSKRSWHTLSRSTSGSSSRTTQLRLGTITTTPNPCFVNMHRVSCDSSGTSLGNWFQERVCHSPLKVETSLFTHFGPRGRIWSLIKIVMHEVSTLSLSSECSSRAAGLLPL